MARGRPKTAITPCRHCGRQFKRSEHLIRHERTHTEERPFVCACGTRFTRQDILARHTKTRRCKLPQDATPEYASSASNELHMNGFDTFWDQTFIPLAETLATIEIPVFGLDPKATSETAANVTSFSQFSSNLPPLDLVDNAGDSYQEGQPVLGAHQHQIIQEDEHSVSAPWSISRSTFEGFAEEIRRYQPILPDGCQEMPTNNMLSRGLETYFRCAFRYLPFIHVATFSVDERDVEMVLVLAALGLLYRFEHNTAYKLYFMARAIWLEKNRREHFQLASEVIFNPEYNVQHIPDKLRKIQTLIIFVIFASWGNRKIRPDGVAMASELGMLVREHGLSEAGQDALSGDWSTWVTSEERRRTIFAAHILSNLHNLAFGTPPVILNHEIDLQLPDFSRPWNSKDTSEWQMAPRQVKRTFQEGLCSLFDGSGFPEEASVSSFSCYILIIGILQQIYLDRRGIRAGQDPASIEMFEVALRAWQASWGGSDEPVLDLTSSKSSFGLSSVALLRLAYIRLNFDRGVCRSALWATVILGEIPPLARSLHVERAVLHAAHALSVLVRLGISYMANTKTPIWSIEHSICSLESAMLLKTWLLMISSVVQSSGIDALRASEKRLLEIVTSIIKESDDGAAIFVHDDVSRYQQMATTVVNLWRRVFNGIHVLEIDDDVRQGLLQAASSTQP